MKLYKKGKTENPTATHRTIRLTCPHCGAEFEYNEKDFHWYCVFYNKKSEFDAFDCPTEDCKETFYIDKNYRASSPDQPIRKTYNKKYHETIVECISKKQLKRIERNKRIKNKILSIFKR